MDIFKEKQCVVCGKPTQQACSKCKELYFCSAEHQRVLWSVHKHLCGKKGFSPPLTEAEVEYAVSHPREPLRLDLTAMAMHQNNGKSNYENMRSGPPLLQALVREECCHAQYPGYVPRNAYDPGLAFAFVAQFEHKIYCGAVGPYKDSSLPIIHQLFKAMTYLFRLEEFAKWHVGKPAAGVQKMEDHVERYEFVQQWAVRVQRYLVLVQPRLGGVAINVRELVTMLQGNFERILGGGGPKTEEELLWRVYPHGEHLM
ncbi:hypothetical protein BCR35DRAFT_299099 [Leucosporidium creatinivorum]|uniref:MYND-type domain-containing protein n=1 Tax=Leucosporidium creatinivorum TaxID=106004 RepID=A0A1Y2G476_9BASI|nr:hypothetical protein BCR35DRAFT_299099 [Leucosporidium creatinivorum]